MGQQQATDSRELKDAFSLFNQASDQLADSYRILEDRVHQLTDELAIERSRRYVRDSDNEQVIRRFEGLLDALPAAVIVLDGDGYVQQCNRAATELIGEPLLSVLWRDVVVRAFQSSACGDDVPLIDGRIVNIATRPACNAPGQIILLTDVTEARTMQALLSRHQRLSAMGEMVASIAHQIRTPLASGLLYASHLKRDDLDQGRRSRYADQIVSRLQHLEHLVNDMLVFARGGNFSADQIKLTTLLSELQQMMAPQLTGKACELEIINSDDVKISGHHEALSAVLQNLVLNAIQACDKGEGMSAEKQVNGHVIVECRNVTAETIDIFITDNGHGISLSMQERIFEPFFTTKPQGTGLGLAVVQAIVHAHDGAIWIESSSDKQYGGTTFAMRLPLFKGDVDK
ncbi:MAG: PAS domain-containing protein [Thiotrichaceae bacterium]|nr:PAS domain-containing protein [Thiotrichaceae bacterium]PCI15124.1 MAG: PAS domain-containing sensor histidine kinase [Thiotrichales bacterium]